MSVFCVIYSDYYEIHIVGGVYFTTVEKANQAKDRAGSWAYLHPLDCQVENIAKWDYHRTQKVEEIVQDLTLADDMTMGALREHVYPGRCWENALLD